MYRATTPTHKFCFGTINPNSFKEILITYVQNGNIVLEKKKQDLVITSKETEEKEETIICYYAELKLSQEETKLFSIKNGNNIDIQIRAIDHIGNVAASNKMKVSLLDVLNDEVLK